MLSTESISYKTSAGPWQYKGEWKMILQSKRGKNTGKTVVNTIIKFIAMSFGNAEREFDFMGGFGLSFMGDRKLQLMHVYSNFQTFPIDLECPLHSFLPI